MEEPGQHEAIIIIGPPGVGKTPILAAIKGKGYAGFDFSDAIKDASERSKTIRERVARFSDRGELIPDEVAIPIFDEYYHTKIRTGNFGVSGFGRTVRQLNFLLPALRTRSYGVTVLFSDATDIVCKRRVLHRLKMREEKYRQTRNLRDKPRADDLPEVHDFRLRQYRETFLDLRRAATNFCRFPVDRVLSISTMRPIPEVEERARQMLFVPEMATQ
ncbi:MAG TPA: nucleoside monophosphate kinase [Candidatus Paceibacterota bacterium]